MTNLFGKEPLEVYDTAEPIVAHRWWRYEMHPLYLRDYITNPAKVVTNPNPFALTSWLTLWPTTGGLVADCIWDFCKDNHSPEDIPVKTSPAKSGLAGYGCGFYGYKDIEHGANHPPSMSYSVYGKVLLAGRIVRHEQGYRARKAKVAGIYSVSPEENESRGEDHHPAFPYLGVRPDNTTLEKIAKFYNVPFLDLPEACGK